MKKRNVILWIFVILLALFAISCEKGDKITSQNIVKYKKFDDIEIPANFNFETNNKLTLEIHAPNTATVVVVGNDGIEYYRTLTSDTEAISRSFQIPATVTSLDFHYRGEVFSNYSVSSLMNNPEVLLYHFGDEEGKSFNDNKAIHHVVPILEGIVVNGDGSYTSWWGYNNQFNETKSRSIGGLNGFTGVSLTPVSYDQGQPTEFLPGRHYNVFSVNFTPATNVLDTIRWTLTLPWVLYQTASPSSPIHPGVDTDRDGVIDGYDMYPNDPTRAYDVFFPSEGIYGTLAFEDLWPEKGDYDFNDMVIRYNIKEVVSATNKIADIYFDLYLTAVGANYKNGFFIELPIPAEDISLNNASHPDLTFLTNETGNAIIQVFYDTDDLIVLAKNEFMNTIPGTPHIAHIPISFSVAVSGDNTASEISNFAPYNPFIIINRNRGKEVHLPGYPPTANANHSFFNNGFADATDIGTGWYYKTALGAPWAICVPATFEHPLEHKDIVVAYERFGNWVASGGTADQDWYLSPTEEAVYPCPNFK